MKPRWHLLSVIVPAAILLLTGCEDSKNPLSDPQTSKADERLVGMWRDQGGVWYFVGHAGKQFPDSVMRVVEITHKEGKVEPPEEYLIFPTVLGDKTYLNLVMDGDKGQVKRLDKDGWKADAVDCYSFLKYQWDGDKMVLRPIDEEAKEKAIKSGKLKGVIENDNPAKFTDTTENVACFVAEAGDSLWNTKERDRFERIEATKKP
jgi:hypothetical protein